jgi:DNA-binding NarL/FixJ family response regulator
MNKQLSQKGINVIVADGHPMFRKGLSSTLKNIPNIKKVVEAKDGSELLSQIKKDSFDLVFLDIFMPIIDGETAAHSIHDKYPHIRMIVISMCDDPYTIRRLYVAGCHGYLGKNAGEQEIRKAIKTVLSKEKYFDTSIMEKIILQSDKNDKLLNPKLTLSEIKLIPLFCAEKSNKQIAGELYLSIRTIETHRYNIYTKTKVKNLSGLVQFAIRQRIL